MRRIAGVALVFVGILFLIRVATFNANVPSGALLLLIIGVSGIVGGIVVLNDEDADERDYR